MNNIFNLKILVFVCFYPWLTFSTCSIFLSECKLKRLGCQFLILASQGLGCAPVFFTLGNQGCRREGHNLTVTFVIKKLEINFIYNFFITICLHLVFYVFISWFEHRGGKGLIYIMILCSGFWLVFQQNIYLDLFVFSIMIYLELMKSWNSPSSCYCNLKGRQPML